MIKFADRMRYLKASDIRELLKITEKSEVISFGGGLPAAELFPVEKLKDVTVRVLDESGAKALQYAPTEGNTALRGKIAERMNKKAGTSLRTENILITTGSQQGLDITGKVFMNENDKVLCESPTYLGAINAFRAYGPKLTEVPTDDHGMKIDALEQMLERDENIRLIYVVPDFQNPSGRTWSLDRRKQFMEVVERYGVPVVEDSPYSELRFEGERIPSLKSMDRIGLVVYLGTFSKIFCPGMRIGWVAADEEILSKYVLVKQGIDLHSSEMNQHIIAKYMDMHDLDADIAIIQKVYKKRRDAMVNAMEREFPDGVKYTRPSGGLFTWVELPGYIDARELLMECLLEGVVFVPGDAFFPANQDAKNTMRLNYSCMTEDKIDEGISILGGILRKHIV